MPRFSDTYAPQYMKAESFAVGEERELVIGKVTQEPLKGKHRPVAVLHFGGVDEPLRLNDVNAQFMHNSLGDDVQQCLGKSIIVYRIENVFVDDAGKVWPGLRLRLPSGQKPPTAQERLKQEIDDEIPF